MKMKKITSVIASAMAVTVLLTACGSTAGTTTTNSTSTTNDTSTSDSGSTTDSTQAADNTSEAGQEAEAEQNSETTEIKWSITIPGKSGSLCNSPTYIAYEKGFFAEEGIDVELITADFEAKKVGLNNGTIATINGDFQYFPSIEADINMTIVEGLHLGCIKVEVLPDSDINGPEDIRGKTIAVDEIGGTPHQVALLWLAQNGVSESEVTFLPFDSAALQIEALQQGAADVAALWDPVATTAEVEGTTRVLLDIAKDEPFAGHYCCFLYASTKVLEEQPELVAAELRAYHKAQNWIYENPEEAVELVTEAGYVSIDDHELAVELLKSYGYPSEADIEQKTLDVEEDVRYFAEQLYDIGFLTSDLDEYVEKAFTAVDLTLGQ